MEYPSVCLVCVGLAWAAGAYGVFPSPAGQEPLGAEFFQTQFARAKRLVDEQLPLRLEATLELREGPSSIDGRPDSPFVAFVRRSDRKIILSPSRFEKLCVGRLKAARNAEDLAFVLFLHELLHVYQDGVLSTQKVQPAARWLRFLCEGHAVTCAEAIARSHGVTEDVLAAARTPAAKAFRGEFDTDRELLRSHFYYTLSAQFVHARGIRAGEFAKLLTATPSYPEVLGCDSKKMKAASPLASERLRALAKARPELGLRPIAEIDYFELCFFLCPAAFDDRALCEALRGGAITNCEFTDGSTADVLVLELVADAQRSFIAKLGAYAALCGSRGQTASLVAAVPTRLADYPSRGRSCHVGRGEPLMVIVVADDGDVAASFIRICLSALDRSDVP